MTTPKGPTVTRWVRWLGLAAVLTAAAVLSFHGLRDLALAVSIPAGLAWLLPVAVDAGAAVSCACWLSREVPVDAARFACRQTWLLLAGTVIGNAAQLGMHAAALAPPWWVAVLVGAIPPAVVGGTIHLAVLVGRTQVEVPVVAEPPAPVEVVAVPDDLLVRARELVADGAGRTRLMAELDVTDHRARHLLRQARGMEVAG